MGEYDVGNWAFLRKIFVINGLIQSFTWFVLAITCVVLFFTVPSSITYFTHVMISQYTSWTDLISFCLYDTLLDRGSTNKDHLVMPVYFHVIVWLYAAFSACWFGLSVHEYLVLFKRKSRKYTAHILMMIGVVTSALCILDLTVFILAMVDYLTINPFDYSIVLDYPDYHCDFPADIDLQLRYRIGRKISFGLLMVLAARGFILWLLNCATSSLCYFISSRIFHTPSILQYEETLPRPKLITRDLLSDSIRLSVETLYEDDVFSNPATEDHSWYYQPPAPRIHEANNEVPSCISRR